MEELNQNIDKGQDKAKKLLAETESTADDLQGEKIYADKVNAFQDFVATLQIGPEAKRGLYSDVNQFFSEQIMPLIPFEKQNFIENAADFLQGQLSSQSASEERSEELLVKGTQLEDVVDQGIAKAQELEQQEIQRIQDLEKAAKEAREYFEMGAHSSGEVMMLKNQAEKTKDEWEKGNLLSEAEQLRKGADFQFAQSVEIFRNEIKKYEGEKTDFSGEFAVKLDAVKLALAHALVQLPDYQVQVPDSNDYDEKTKKIDEERAKLLLEVQRNEAYRGLLAGIAEVYEANPKAFEDFKNFNLWVEAVGGDFTFKKYFFEVDDETRKGVMLRIQAEVAHERDKQGLEKETGYKRDYFEGKIALANGKIHAATIHLKKYYDVLVKDNSLPENEKKQLLGETKTLLTTIAVQKCLIIQGDISQLIGQRGERTFVSASDANIDAANGAMLKVLRVLNDGQALTFEEAWEKSGIKKELVTIGGGEMTTMDQALVPYEMILKATATDDPAERARMVASAVEKMDSYGGSTKVARRMLDEHLKDDLNGLVLDKETLTKLRMDAERDATKYGQDIKEKLQEEVKGMVKQVEKIDKKMRVVGVMSYEYRQLKASKEDLIKRLNESSEAVWAKEGDDNVAKLKASDWVNPKYVAARTGEALEDHYQRLVRKEKYLMLSKTLKDVDAEKLKMVEAAIDMDDLRDETGNFARDSINEGVDKGAEVAFDIGTMVVGMGSGALVKLAASKALARLVAKGGVEAALARGTIWASQHIGEGFGSHVSNSTMQAMGMMMRGESGADAFDDFAAGWGQSALLFASISGGGELVGGVFGGGKLFGKQFEGVKVTTKTGEKVAIGEAKFAELGRAGQAKSLAYQGGQMITEMAMNNVSETAADALDHLFTGSPMSKQNALDNWQVNLENMVKFRIGAKLWKSTRIGKEMYAAEDRVTDKANRNVARAQAEAEARAAYRNGGVDEASIKVEKGAEVGETDLEDGDDDSKKRKISESKPEVNDGRADKPSTFAKILDFLRGKASKKKVAPLTEEEKAAQERAKSIQADYDELVKNKQANLLDGLPALIEKHKDSIFTPGAMLRLGTNNQYYEIVGVQQGMDNRNIRKVIVFTLSNGATQSIDANALQHLIQDGAFRLPTKEGSDAMDRIKETLNYQALMSDRSDHFDITGNSEQDLKEKMKKIREVDPRTGEPYDMKPIPEGATKEERIAIRKQNNEKIKAGIKFIAEQYKEQAKVIRECADKVMIYLEKNPNATYLELQSLVLTSEVRNKLSPDQVRKIDKALMGAAKRVAMVNEWHPKLKKDPLRTVEKLLGLKEGVLKGPIRIVRDKGVINLEVTNIEDYAKMRNSTVEESKRSGGFAFGAVGENDPRNVLTVSRVKGSERISTHEAQHQRNKLLFEDFLGSSDVNLDVAEARSALVQRLKAMAEIVDPNKLDTEEDVISAYTKLKGELRKQSENGDTIQERNSAATQARELDIKWGAYKKAKNYPLLRARDEIIAYLKDGSSPEAVAEVLTREGDLYDYYKTQRKAASTPEERAQIDKQWSAHIKEVKRLLEIANNVRGADGKIDVDLLAIVPPAEWKLFTGEEKRKLEVPEHKPEAAGEATLQPDRSKDMNDRIEPRVNPAAFKEGEKVLYKGEEWIVDGEMGDHVVLKKPGAKLDREGGMRGGWMTIEKRVLNVDNPFDHELGRRMPREQFLKLREARGKVKTGEEKVKQAEEELRVATDVKERLSRDQNSVEAKLERINHGQLDFNEVHRETDVVYMPDIHGDVEALKNSLQAMDLINANGEWVGGNKVLVFSGDYIDRGSSNLETLRLMKKVSVEAKKAGGRVDFLVGNHEALMIGGISGSTVTLGNWVAQGGAKVIEEVLKAGNLPTVSDPASVIGDVRILEIVHSQLTRGKKLPFTPEQLASAVLKLRQMTFEKGGEFEGLFDSMNVASQVDDVLYVHAGIDPKWSEMIADPNVGVDGINAQWREAFAKAKQGDLSAFAKFNQPGSSRGGNKPGGEFGSPLWIDFYAEMGGMTQQEVEQTAANLKKAGINAMVVGHTKIDESKGGQPQKLEAFEKAGIKIINADVGMSGGYRSGKAGVGGARIDTGGNVEVEMNGSRVAVHKEGKARDIQAEIVDADRTLVNKRAAFRAASRELGAARAEVQARSADGRDLGKTQMLPAMDFGRPRQAAAMMDGGEAKTRMNSPQKVGEWDDLPTPLDRSDVKVFRSEIAKLKADLKAQKIDKDTYQRKSMDLHRRRYLDLMSNIMSKAEMLMENNPDVSADDAYNFLVNHPTNNLQPSKWQKKMIKAAVEKYVKQRAEIREVAKELDTLEGKRKFLDDAGLTDVKVEDVEFDFSHPISVGVIFKNKADYVKFFVANLRGGSPELDKMIQEQAIRGESSGGAYFSDRTFSDQRLNNKVYAYTADSKDVEKRVKPHELQHRMFAEFLNHANYEGSRGREVQVLQIANGSMTWPEKVDAIRKLGLLDDVDPSGHDYVAESIINEEVMKHRMRDETLAYLKGSDFYTKPKGLIYDKLSVQNQAVRRNYEALANEISRLKELGYDPKAVYEKVKAAESFTDLVIMLREIGKVPDRSTKADLEKLMKQMSEAEVGFLNDVGLIGEVDPYTSLPRSLDDRVRIVKAFIKDRMRYKSEFEEVAQRLNTIEPEIVTRLVNKAFDQEVGLMTWGRRLDIAEACLSALTTSKDMEDLNPALSEQLKEMALGERDGILHELKDVSLITNLGDIASRLKKIQEKNPEVARRIASKLDPNLNETNTSEVLDIVNRYLADDVDITEVPVFGGENFEVNVGDARVESEPMFDMGGGGADVNFRAMAEARLNGVRPYWNREMAEQSLFERGQDLDGLVSQGRMSPDQAAKEKQRYREQFEKEKMAALIMAVEDFVTVHPEVSDAEVLAHIQSLSWLKEGRQMDDRAFNSFQRGLVEAGLARYRELSRKVDGLEKNLSSKLRFHFWKDKFAESSKFKEVKQFANLKFDDFRLVRGGKDHLVVYVKPEVFVELFGNVGGFYLPDADGLMVVKDKPGQRENRERHELQHHRFQEFFGSIDRPVSPSHRDLFSDRTVRPEVAGIHKAVQKSALNELASYVQAHQSLGGVDALVYVDRIKKRADYIENTPEGQQTLRDVEVAREEMQRLIDAGYSREKLANLARVSNSLEELNWNLKQLRTPDIYDIDVPGKEKIQSLLINEYDANGQLISDLDRKKAVDLLVLLKKLPMIEMPEIDSVAELKDFAKDVDRLARDMGVFDTEEEVNMIEPNVQPKFEAKPPTRLERFRERGVESPDQKAEVNPLAPTIETHRDLPDVDGGAIRREALEGSLRKAGLLSEGETLRGKDWDVLWQAYQKAQEGEMMSVEARRLLMQHLKSLPGERADQFREIIGHARDNGFLAPREELVETLSSAEIEFDSEGVKPQPLPEAKQDSVERKFAGEKALYENDGDVLLEVFNNQGSEALVRNFGEAISAIERGETPTGEMGRVILAVRQRDPHGYDILLNNDLSALEKNGVLYGIVKGDKIKFENQNGERVTAYKGTFINDGAFGNISHVGFVMGYGHKLEFAVIKKPMPTPDGERVFAKERASQLNMKNWDNKNIAKPLQIGEKAIIYESADGAKDLLKSYESGMKIKPCLSAIREVINGVKEIHSHGLFHGDIKPANVVMMNGVAKIVDNTLTPGEGFTEGFAGTAAYGYEISLILGALATLHESGIEGNERSNILARAWDTCSVAKMVKYAMDGRNIVPSKKLESLINRIAMDPIFAGKPSTPEEPSALERLDALLTEEISALN